MTTYLIENEYNEVVDYSKYFDTAKRIAKQLPVARVTKLVDSYYGEGYHAYYLNWNGRKFTRTYRKGLK
jgi:hypothetical protein